MRITAILLIHNNGGQIMQFWITQQSDPKPLTINQGGRQFGFVQVVDGVCVPGTRNVCYEVFVGGRGCW